MLWKSRENPHATQPQPQPLPQENTTTTMFLTSTQRRAKKIKAKQKLLGISKASKTAAVVVVDDNDRNNHNVSFGPAVAVAGNQSSRLVVVKSNKDNHEKEQHHPQYPQHGSFVVVYPTTIPASESTASATEATTTTAALHVHSDASTASPDSTIIYDFPQSWSCDHNNDDDKHKHKKAPNITHPSNGNNDCNHQTSSSTQEQQQQQQQDAPDSPLSVQTPLLVPELPQEQEQQHQQPHSPYAYRYGPDPHASDDLCLFIEALARHMQPASSSTSTSTSQEVIVPEPTDIRSSSDDDNDDAVSRIRQFALEALQQTHGPIQGRRLATLFAPAIESAARVSVTTAAAGGKNRLQVPANLCAYAAMWYTLQRLDEEEARFQQEEKEQQQQQRQAAATASAATFTATTPEQQATKQAFRERLIRSSSNLSAQFEASFSTINSKEERAALLHQPAGAEKEIEPRLHVELGSATATATAATIMRLAIPPLPHKKHHHSSRCAGETQEQRQEFQGGTDDSEYGQFLPSDEEEEGGQETTLTPMMRYFAQQMDELDKVIDEFESQHPQVGAERLSSSFNTNGYSHHNGSLVKGGKNEDSNSSIQLLLPENELRGLIQSENVPLLPSSRYHDHEPKIKGGFASTTTTTTTTTLQSELGLWNGAAPKYDDAATREKDPQLLQAKNEVFSGSVSSHASNHRTTSRDHNHHEEEENDMNGTTPPKSPRRERRCSSPRSEEKESAAQLNIQRVETTQQQQLLQEMQRKYESSHQELVSVRHERDAMQTDWERDRELLARQRLELKQTRAKNAQLEETARILEMTREELLEALELSDALQLRQDRTQQECDTLQRHVSELEETLAQTKENLELVTRQRDDGLAKMMEQESQLDEYANRCSHVEHDWEDAQNEANNARRTENAARAQLDLIAVALHDAHDKNRALAAEISSLQHEKESMQALSQQSELQILEAKKRMDQMEIQISNLKDELSSTIQDRDDVRSELEDRISSLQNEKDKAQQLIEELRADIQNKAVEQAALDLTAALSLQHANEKNQGLAEEIRQLEFDRERSMAEISSLQNEKESTQARLKKCDDEVSESKKRMDRMEIQIYYLTDELAALLKDSEDVRTGLEEKISSLQNERDQAQEWIEELCADVQMKEATQVELDMIAAVALKDAQEKNRDLTEEICQLELALEQSKDDTFSLQNENESLQALSKKYENQIMTANTQIDRMEIQIANLQQELLTTIKDNDDVRCGFEDRISSLQHEKDQAQTIIEELRVQHAQSEEAAQAKLDLISAALQNANEKNRGLTEEIGQVQLALENSKAEISSLQKEKESLQGISKKCEIQILDANKLIELMEIRICNLEMELVTTIKENDAVHHGLEDRISSLQKEKDKAHKLIEELRADVQSKEATQAQLDLIAAALHDEQGKNQALAEKIGQLELARAASAAEISSLQNEKESMQAISKKCEIEVLESNEQMDRMEIEICNLEKELVTTIKENNAIRHGLEDMISSLQKEKDEAQKLIDELRADVQSKEATQSKLDLIAVALHDEQRKNRALTETMGQLESARAASAAEISLLHNEKKSLQAVAKKCQIQKFKANKQIDRMEIQICNLQEDLVTTIKENEAVRHGLEDRISSLQNERDEAQKLNEELRADVQSKEAAQAELDFIGVALIDEQEKNRALAEKIRQLELARVASAAEISLLQTEKEYMQAIPENCDVEIFESSKQMDGMEIQICNLGNAQKSIEKLRADVQSKDGTQAAVISEKCETQKFESKRLVDLMEIQVCNMQEERSTTVTDNDDVGHGLEDMISSLKDERDEAQKLTEELRADVESKEASQTELDLIAVARHDANDKIRPDLEEEICWQQSDRKKSRAEVSVLQNEQESMQAILEKCELQIFEANKQIDLKEIQICSLKEELSTTIKDHDHVRHRLEDMISSFQNKWDEAQILIEELRAAVQKKDATQSELDLAAAALHDAHEKNRALTEKASQLELAHAASAAEISSLQNEKKSMQAISEKCEIQILEANKLIDLLETQVCNLRAELSTNNKDNKDVRSGLDDRISSHSEKANAQILIEELRAEIKIKKARQAELDLMAVALQDANEKNRGLTEEIRLLQRDRDTSTAEMSSLQNEKEFLQAISKKCELQIIEANKVIELMEIRICNLQEELVTTIQNGDDCRNGLEAMITCLQNDKKNARMVIDELRAEMQSKASEAERTALEAEARMEDLQLEVNAAARAKHKALEDLLAVSTQLQQATDKLNELALENQEWKNNLFKAENERDSARSKTIELLSTNDELNNTVAQLKLSEARGNQKLLTIEQETEEALACLEELELNLERTQGEVVELRSENQVLKNQLRDITKFAQSAAAELKRKTGYLESTQARVAKLSRSIDVARHNASEELSSLRRENDQSVSRFVQLPDDGAVARGEHERLQSLYETTLNELNDTRSTHGADTARLRAELSSLQSLYETTYDQLNHARSDLATQVALAHAEGNKVKHLYERALDDLNKARLDLETQTASTNVARATVDQLNGQLIEIADETARAQVEFEALHSTFETTEEELKRERLEREKQAEYLQNAKETIDELGRKIQSLESERKDRELGHAALRKEKDDAVAMQLEKQLSENQEMLNVSEAKWNNVLEQLHQARCEREFLMSEQNAQKIQLKYAHRQIKALIESIEKLESELSEVTSLALSLQKEKLAAEQSAHVSKTKDVIQNLQVHHSSAENQLLRRELEIENLHGELAKLLSSLTTANARIHDFHESIRVLESENDPIFTLLEESNPSINPSVVKEKLMRETSIQIALQTDCKEIQNDFWITKQSQDLVAAEAVIEDTTEGRKMDSELTETCTDLQQFAPTTDAVVSPQKVEKRRSCDPQPTTKGTNKSKGQPTSEKSDKDNQALVVENIGSISHITESGRDESDSTTEMAAGESKIDEAGEKGCGDLADDIRTGSGTCLVRNETEEVHSRVTDYNTEQQAFSQEFEKPKQDDTTFTDASRAVAQRTLEELFLLFGDITETGAVQFRLTDDNNTEQQEVSQEAYAESEQDDKTSTEACHAAAQRTVEELCLLFGVI